MKKISEEEKQSRDDVVTAIKSDQDYWQQRYETFMNNPKRTKGEKTNFSKMLTQYMDDNKVRIKDFVHHILGIKKDLSDLQAYQNAVSKVSNWRTGRTLPSTVEMVKIKQAIEFNFDENVTFLELLYGNSYEYYVTEYLRDLYKNFILYDKTIGNLDDANRENKEFKFHGFSLTGKQIRESLASWNKYFSSSANSFEYAVNYVNYRKKHELDPSFFTIIYFKWVVINNLDGTKLFRKKRDTSKNFKKYQDLCESIFDDFSKYSRWGGKNDISFLELADPIEKTIHFYIVDSLSERSDTDSFFLENVLSSLYLTTYFKMKEVLTDVDDSDSHNGKMIIKRIENATDDYLIQLSAINKTRSSLNINDPTDYSKLREKWRKDDLTRISRMILEVKTKRESL